MRRAFVLLLSLSLSPALARGDDNPEPPGKGGPEMRKLQGKWAVTRRVLRGKDVQSKVVQTYEFAGDKVTVDSGKFKYVATVKLDVKNKPMVLELTREGVKAISKIAFKFDKGELYLAVAAPPQGKVSADEDFSGKDGMLMVLSREKKKE
jgi:uncharacterized protein (TIGR03067 family)